MAAISYQESHWNPEATSPTERGMMMLTKATADRMNITNRLSDPEQSIKAGSEYLHLLLKQMPDTILKEDRIWFTCRL